MDKKTKPAYIYTCCLQDTHCRSKDTHRLKVKGWKEKKKARVAVLISNKIDFQTKAIYSRRQRTLHNDKGKNPTRGYNPSKHLCT